MTDALFWPGIAFMIVGFASRSLPFGARRAQFMTGWCMAALAGALRMYTEIP